MDFYRRNYEELALILVPPSTPPNKQPASFDGSRDSYQGESLLWLGGLTVIFTKDLIPFSGFVWHNGRIMFDVFPQGTALINLHPSKWE